MFGRLIRLHKKAQESGGQLVLRDMTAQVYEVFEITRLNKLFDIRRDDN
jgi:anti-anti-sigma regulatory factor